MGEVLAPVFLYTLVGDSRNLGSDLPLLWGRPLPFLGIPGPGLTTPPPNRRGNIGREG